MKISRKLRKGITITVLALMPFIISDTNFQQIKEKRKQVENERLIRDFDISQLNMSTKQEKDLQAKVEEKLDAYTPKTSFSVPYINSDVKTELHGIDRGGGNFEI